MRVVGLVGAIGFTLALALILAVAVLQRSPSEALPAAQPRIISLSTIGAKLGLKFDEPTDACAVLYNWIRNTGEERTTATLLARGFTPREIDAYAALCAAHPP